MRKLLLIILAFYFCQTKAQTVSTFMETNSVGCYGLTIDDNFLYVVSSFSGKVHRKELTSTDSSYETFTIGGSGYQGICKVGNYVYISKPYNGASGIYRFDITSQNVVPENFISLNHAFGLAHKNSDLFVSSADKIYRIDLTAAAPALIQIASNISGVGGTNGSTIGLKVFGNYLYVSESTGISKINLESGGYEKETITTYSGTSFAVKNQDKLYLTGNTLSGVDQLDIPTQTSSVLAEVEGFIGIYDIVFANNALFVTTQEGDYNKVAKIDLSQLHVIDYLPLKPSIFPNPATDFLNLLHFDKNVKIVIVNQVGQEILVENDNGKIDISNLKTGMYYIRTDSWNQKFIKK